MPPRKGKRKAAEKETDYSNIGVAGRKTGITLKDTGVRDEHGLEPIEGIFSSPEKPQQTTRSNKRTSSASQGISKGATISTEESMDIAGSNLDPSELVNSRRITLPPPRSRSPMKTHLNSPARRSVGPPSSPSRPSRTTGTDLGGASLEDLPTPKIGDPSKTNGAGTSLFGKARRKSNRTFDLGGTDDEDEEGEPLPQEDEPMENGLDDEAPVLEDEDMPMDDDWDGGAGPNDQLEQELVAPPSKKRNRLSRPARDPTPEELEELEADEHDQPPAKKQRGRPPKAAKPARAAHDAMPPQQQQPKKARGRPPGKASSRNAAAATTTDMPPPPAPAPPGPPLGQRGARPGKRTLALLRSTETPADGSATVLRSGRTSVRPVAYWRNERIVWGEGFKEGDKITLPSIKEVVRYDEPDERPRRKAPAAGAGEVKRKGGRKARRREEEDEDEEEELEPWELEPGVLIGETFDWDRQNDATLEDELMEEGIAYATKGINDSMREVKGQSFTFGKTIAMPFFHAGIVDLPPGGEKRMKNSRRNHMVFFLHTGRVSVNVSNNEFSIGKGGIWQVPRGNHYSISNPNSVPARVFFAQGCICTRDEEEEWLENLESKQE